MKVIFAEDSDVEVFDRLAGLHARVFTTRGETFEGTIVGSDEVYPGQDRDTVNTVVLLIEDFDVSIPFNLAVDDIEQLEIGP
jgi:hypothetical protein